MIPEGVDIAVGSAIIELLEPVWRGGRLPYEWNPCRIAMRNRGEGYRLSRFGGFLVLSYPAPEDAGFATLLWGEGESEDLRAAMAGRLLVRVGSRTADHVLTTAYGTELAAFPARNFDEYLYDLDAQVGLSGSRFARRRTYLRALERSATTVEFVDLDLSSTADLAEVGRLYSGWMTGRDATASIVDERAALATLLEGDIPHRAIGLAGLRVDGELAGFAAYDVLAPDVATAHFIKSRSGGAETAATWQSFFASARRRGATTANGGYDGGVGGLREAKLGLRPSSMSEMFFLIAENAGA